MTTLLLTDCLSHDQAYAAAAAMRVFPDADLRFANWREICDVLEGPAFDYDTILLLGVSLLYDSTRAAMALNELRETGCKVHYFTTDREYFAPAPLGQVMRVHCNPNWLATAVLDFYDLAANDLRIDDPECSRHAPQVCQFVEAAWEYLRQSRDDAPARQVISALAQDGAPANWSRALHELHRHWLRHAPQPLPECPGEAWCALREQIDALLPTWWQESHAAVPVLLRGEAGAPLRDLATHLQCPALFTFDCATGDEALLRQAILQADGAALLLEEIGVLDFAAQRLLLHAMETGWLTRPDGTRHAVRLRWLFTTHQDLAPLTRAELFLPELHQRLQTCEIAFPPLRERPEDLETIAEDLCRRRGFPLPTHALETLQGYDFPGNEAELAVLLERASLLAPEAFRTFVAERPPAVVTPPGRPATASLETAMRSYVQTVVKQCGGNKSMAAQRLGITRTTLRKYL